MKHTLRKITNAVARCVPAPLARHWLKSYWYQPALQDAVKFHVQPQHFHSAIPTRSELDYERLNRRRALPGVALNTERALKLLDEFLPYAAEMLTFPLEEKPGVEFYFHNYAYQDLDAVTLYCAIRHLKPRRITEAGCGFSSRVISLAARKNAAEGHPIECTFIEPYPSDRILRDRLAGPLVEKLIEDVPLSSFRELQAGDFLFIDTSHVIKMQNDCCYEYLELLPSLRPGVFVHVHDIFTPYDYPEEWVRGNLFAYNEQYALECLLTGNANLETVLPLYYLWKEHPQAMARFFPGNAFRPAGYWMKTK